jgi:hypothetical protein
MTRLRYVMPDLPTFVDAEYAAKVDIDADDHNTSVIKSVLGYAADKLIEELQSTIGTEREAVREQLRRFQKETLAGLIAGPHVLLGEPAAASLRASARTIDLKVATALSEY